MPNLAESRFCAATAGLSAPAISKCFWNLMRRQKCQTTAGTLTKPKPITRRGVPAYKINGFPGHEGKQPEGNRLRRARLRIRHHNCSSAGTVSRVWSIIMNIPTVRMNPNSASPLKLAVASEAVAVAAVTMQRKTLSPVVSKVRNTASFSVPPFAHSCGTRLKKCTIWSSPSPARIAIKDRLIRFTSPG